MSYFVRIIVMLLIVAPIVPPKNPGKSGCEMATILNENPQAALWNATCVPLEGCVPPGFAALWTTDGDGYFDDPTSPNTIYRPGTEDLHNVFITVTLTANCVTKENHPPTSGDLSLEFILRK